MRKTLLRFGHISLQCRQRSDQRPNYVSTLAACSYSKHRSPPLPNKRARWSFHFASQHSGKLLLLATIGCYHLRLNRGSDWEMTFWRILTCCLVNPVSAVISLISSSCSCSCERELPISRKLQAGSWSFLFSKKKPEREVGEGEVGDGEGEGGHDWTGSPGRVLPWRGRAHHWLALVALGQVGGRSRRAHSLTR